MCELSVCSCEALENHQICSCFFDRVASGNEADYLLSVATSWCICLVWAYEGMWLHFFAGGVGNWHWQPTFTCRQLCLYDNDLKGIDYEYVELGPILARRLRLERSGWNLCSLARKAAIVSTRRALAVQTYFGRYAMVPDQGVTREPFKSTSKEKRWLYAGSLFIVFFLVFTLKVLWQNLGPCHIKFQSFLVRSPIVVMSWSSCAVCFWVPGWQGLDFHWFSLNCLFWGPGWPELDFH